VIASGLATCRRARTRGAAGGYATWLKEADTSEHFKRAEFATRAEAQAVARDLNAENNGTRYIATELDWLKE
jgi:hypothetical protein